MALKANVKFKGITVQDAYVKVVNFAGDKTHIAFVLGCYGPASEQGEREQFNKEQHQIPYALDGGNALEQAYQYLKTLPEFTDAVDC